MHDTERRQRIVVGMTGATGSAYGVRILEYAHELGVETHLIVSPWGARTLKHETGLSVDDLRETVDVIYRAGDQGARVSSGSFPTDGMIIAPCSVKTAAAIANGLAADLVSRAADVTLKERRRLVLLVRETPLSEIHLVNLLTLTRAGAIVVPPVPAFYNHPKTIEDIVDYTAVRALDQIGLRIERDDRWGGQLATGNKGT